ncbi:MAG: aldo/keto reductase [Bacteroidetes bacterium]|nr:aldo/keto reductase [Bacteroidota bacterium]
MATQKRKIGNSDLEILPWIFGGNVFGWTADEKRSFELLNAFVEKGFDCIDTADSYSRWAQGNKGGESETIIGKWMKERGNRNKIIIATKVGSDMGKGKRDISKAYILQAAEDSLRRLQTDHIDLYQTHWDDNVTPVEETLEAYDQLVKQGKVRWIGASNLSAERLNASLDASKKLNYPAYQSLQPLYNLYDRETFEKQYQQLCIKNNLGVITYYSLASGFLSGKYKSEKDLSISQRGEFNKKYFTERGFKIIAALEEVSKQYHTSPAVIALAWLIAQPVITAPIASATKIEQLKELMSAIELKLDNTSLEILNKASSY